MTTNSSNAIQREIKVKEQKLGTVTSFIKYLRAVVSDHGPKPQILSRIAQDCSSYKAEDNLERENNISFGSEVKLMRSLVISIFFMPVNPGL